MKTKKITIVVGDAELPFTVTTADYNRYLDEMTPTDKVAPSENFAKRTLADKEKMDVLNELCDDGLALEIAGNLIQEFRPQVAISVKK